jgi:hypothetical protein
VTSKWPDFLVIGAPKAGTTALFQALEQHPSIYCSPVKEPRYLAYAGKRSRFTGPRELQNAAKVVVDEADYLALFAACPTGAVAGEASTAYLASDSAPVLASRLAPHARLIAILRHPVERAYSQWLHLRQEGGEPIDDFEAAWRAEDGRVAQGYRPVWHYRRRGFYGKHLDRWLEFFDREQLLILFYEDWLQNPAETLAQVFRHLGVGSLSNPVVSWENHSSRQPRWPWLHHRMVEDNALRDWAQRRLPLWLRDAITHSVARVNLVPGPKLDATVRAALAGVFYQDLRRVEELTGRDLDAWRR